MALGRQRRIQMFCDGRAENKVRRSDVRKQREWTGNRQARDRRGDGYGVASLRLAQIIRTPGGAHTADRWAGGAGRQSGAALAGFAGAGFELGPAPPCLMSSSSHQTTKFPPTPSVRSTSASHVRMMKQQYYTLTVIDIPATILYDSAKPHLRASLLLRIHSPPLGIFLCVHAGTPATPIPSYAYFTTSGHPGVGHRLQPVLFHRSSQNPSAPPPRSIRPALVTVPSPLPRAAKGPYLLWNPHFRKTRQQPL